MDHNVFFFLALSFLLTHEMDAVRRYEWQVFPFLAGIRNDQHGYILFTSIHIPLYLFLLWGVFSHGATTNQSFVYGVDSFCIIHVLLHLVFRTHPNYQFNNWFSWTLILGAGIAGGIDILVRV